MNPPETAIDSLEAARERELERELSRVFERTARRAKMRALSAVCRQDREREHAARFATV